MFILKGEQILMIEKLVQWLFTANTAIAEAAAPAAGAGAPQEVSGIAMIIQLVLPIALMVLVFYFLLIRPQKKKDKKVKDMLDNLKVTDRISTIGGIYGTIVSIKDDTFTIAVGKDNVQLVIARWAIRQVEDITVENDSELLA